MNKSNINELDLLKIVIMFCVILFHSFVSYISASDVELWPLLDQNNSFLIDPFILLLVTFGMPLCIMLSGFLLYFLYNKKGPNQFIKNRVSKMVLPLIILFPILSYFLQPYFPAKAETFSVLGLPIYTYHLWFAYYLVMVIITVYLLSLLQKIAILKKIGEWIEKVVIFGVKYRYSWMIFPIISILLPGELKDGVIQISYSAIPNLPMFMSYLFVFYIGWVLNKHRDLLPNVRDNCYITLTIGTITHGFLIAILFGAIDTTIIMETLNVGFKEIVSFMLLIVMWSFSVGLFGFTFNRYGNKKESLEYLANSAFPIYIIHFPVCIFYIYSLSMFNINPFIKGTIVFTLTCMTSFLIHEMIRQVSMLFKK